MKETIEEKKQRIKEIDDLMNESTKKFDEMRKPCLDRLVQIDESENSVLMDCLLEQIETQKELIDVLEQSVKESNDRFKFANIYDKLIEKEKKVIRKYVDKYSSLGRLDSLKINEQQDHLVSWFAERIVDMEYMGSKTCEKYVAFVKPRRSGLTTFVRGLVERLVREPIDAVENIVVFTDIKMEFIGNSYVTNGVRVEYHSMKNFEIDENSNLKRENFTQYIIGKRNCLVLADANNYHPLGNSKEHNCNYLYCNLQFS